MREEGSADGAGERVIRHRLVDRAFHWLMAASIVVLIGTAFLPIWGIKFAWVVPHWIAGAVLIVLVVFHIVRASIFQHLGAVWIGRRDLGDLIGAWRAIAGGGEAPKPGKYSLAQKLYHNVIAVLVVAVCISGGLMMVKQDTPLWKRDPYWLADGEWGIIYIAHGLAAIMIFSMLLIHIYFALRPEKLFYTRSMIKGWVTRGELEDNHDSGRWNAGAAQMNSAPIGKAEKVQ